MNANAITGLQSLAAQTINATAETLLTQTVNGVASTAILSMPPNANVDSHAFRLRLVGKATGGTSATLILKFRLGTTIAGTNIASFTVSGAAIPVAGSNFDVYADLVWDSVSQTLNGTIGGQTGNTITSAAAITQGTGVVAASNLQFVASATFGAALATNTVTVEEFSITQA